MKAYRYSVKLKLGLIVFAGLIAVASLAYTNQLAERLREREQFIIQLWASAQEHLASASQYENPHIPAFREMEERLRNLASQPGLSVSEQRIEDYRDALAWARSMPPPGDVTLAFEIVQQGQFGIPAVITDSARTEPLVWHSVPGVPPRDSLDNMPPDEAREVLDRVIARAHAMAQNYEPIGIELGPGENKLEQFIFYDDSRLVRELTIFPYIQLLFVALFILVGYLGFSYVRRSEQSSLWVGMAKEAAHQLGTPISSLMGWTELLKTGDLEPEQKNAALREIEDDIDRLKRVASRFSDIGSLPKLEATRIAPVIEATADYIRRRIPQQTGHLELLVDVDEMLYAPINVELFEWVIENLLKNALDAIESQDGSIEVRGRREEDRVVIDVSDSGKGIDRQNWKNVFRPGYSTKKRGWGLGLSLAKRIVEDYHGGALTLEQSRVGHGATFRIAIPVASVRESVAEAQAG